MAERSLKEKTAKGLFWGGVSNGAQQLLGMLFGIYLARILNAEDYGLVGMLAIFTGIAGTIINSGFTVALANKQEVSEREYNAVFWFMTFTGAILYVMLFLAAPLIAAFYGRPELTSLSRILFISFFFSGVAGVPYTVMFKRLMVKEQAKIDVFSLFVSGIVGVVLAMRGMAYWALATQTVTYVSVNSLLKCVISPWRPRLIFDFRPLRGMFSFSAKLFLTNIFTQVNNNIFSVLLGKLYTATQVGYYTQGYKWMSMGNSLLSSMINSVAQPVLVEVREDDERLAKIFRKMTRFSVFLSFPLMLGFAFVAKEFILITIGEKWLPSVPILQLLCVIGMIYPMSFLYTQLLISLGKSDIYLKGHLFQGIIQLGTLLAIARWGIYPMIIAYILTYFLTFSYWFYAIKPLINLRLSVLVKDISPYLAITLATFLLVFLITFKMENLYLLLASKVILSASIYSGLLWLSGSVIFKESINLILRKRAS